MGVPVVWWRWGISAGVLFRFRPGCKVPFVADVTLRMSPLRLDAPVATDVTLPPPESVAFRGWPALLGAHGPGPGAFARFCGLRLISRGERRRRSPVWSLRASAAFASVCWAHFGGRVRASRPSRMGGVGRRVLFFARRMSPPGRGGVRGLGPAETHSFRLSDPLWVGTQVGYIVGCHLVLVVVG